MAIQNISYSDKSYINENPSVAATNKITDSDMNEIKSVVNNNATELSNAETTINNVKGIMLFSTNGSGTTSGSISLSDTITDYDVIEVYGYTSDNICVYSKVPKTLFNKKIGLMSATTDGAMYIKLCNLSVDTANNQLTISYNREWYKPYNSASGGYNASGNYVYITNVVGYKTGVFS